MGRVREAREKALEGQIEKESASHERQREQLWDRLQSEEERHSQVVQDWEKRYVDVAKERNLAVATLESEKIRVSNMPAQPPLAGGVFKREGRSRSLTNTEHFHMK